ncbi:carbon-nitrogen hydrolase family protein [Rubellicoccus peritrichatus]|uniref:Carbon-nitrogen hydrolase family protein n=1 Tax=Rubellicoccus peritrichatus TaxID=3080537 RepID=A0AAQ3QV96_9BACT|nr:carbon-nitrogen hydrolase family protein [Puniceicoccus sp. CR14]WOO41328.1 carbon-nitrogen hydrolase family protein [Puniceicoccus sp. CR14]
MPLKHEDSSDRARTTIRVACVQHQLKAGNTFVEFKNLISKYIAEAASKDADFIVFPEYCAADLMSQANFDGLTSRKMLEQLATMSDDLIACYAKLAKDHKIHIVGGSHPISSKMGIENCGLFFYPNGEHQIQPKLHITPWEKQNWNVTGGDTLDVIQTPKANIGILVCYDSEFPEATRELVDQGAEILFVPYCTENYAGYQRVRICCQARAIENQIHVVTTGLTGQLPAVAGFESNYASPGVFTPSDTGFPQDGVLIKGESNIASLTFVDLDMAQLRHSRAEGTVTPHKDRRHDLFVFSKSRREK